MTADESRAELQAACCAACQYYAPHYHYLDRGDCRRHAPGHSGDFPPMRAGEWCGDYAPAPKDVP
jgi:hypothetical protein